MNCVSCPRLVLGRWLSVPPFLCPAFWPCRASGMSGCYLRPAQDTQPVRSSTWAAVNASPLSGGFVRSVLLGDVPEWGAGTGHASPHLLLLSLASQLIGTPGGLPRAAGCADPRSQGHWSSRLPSYSPEDALGVARPPRLCPRGAHAHTHAHSHTFLMLWQPSSSAKCVIGDT